jgi:hypothetical protein
MRMSPRKVFFVACLVVSVFCLAAGYGIAGQWIGVAAAIITGFTWYFARKYLASWLPHICLLGSVGLAVAGRLTGSPPLLMICGSGFSLAAWDLLLLNAALESNTFDEQTRQYENKHLQLLALALAAGFFVAFFGRLLNLQLPFFVMMLLVALVIFGLYRTWGYLTKNKYR